jgi:hypothetical protein
MLAVFGFTFLQHTIDSIFFYDIVNLELSGNNIPEPYIEEITELRAEHCTCNTTENSVDSLDCVT